MGNSETPIPEATEPSTQITVQQEIGRVEDGEVIGVKVDTIIGDVTVKAVQIIDSFVERALTAAEEAKQARAIEAQYLADGVRDFARRLQDLASGSAESAEPYKGLLEYRLSDAVIFLGRAQAVRDFLHTLRRDPLTVLHSDSGAGKTSLLQAGIAPRLLSDGDLPILVRPYDVNPAVAIKRAFVPDLCQVPQLESAPLRDFLHRVCEVLSERTRVFIFLDQFEEFFTRLDERERMPFVRELAECLEDESLNVRWVLSLRTDVFGELATFRPRIRNPFGNDYRLNLLTRAEAQEVIREPAEMRGVHFESQLVGVLLADLGEAGKDQISPPQVQLVCSALYTELNPGEHTITRALYEQQGKAESILRGYLERVLNRTFPAEQRSAARHLLEALVTSDHQRALHTQPELAAELALWNVPSRTVDTIINQLVDGRLLRMQEGGTDGSELAYELVHDYLLGEIELDPKVQARKAAQELLGREVRSFQRYKTLISPERLKVIEQHREQLHFIPEAESLLAQSQMARQRRRQRLTLAAIGAAMTLLVLAIFGGIGWWQSEERRQVALSRRLAIQSTNQLDAGDYDMALLLAIEAGRAADTTEAFAALRQAFAYPERKLIVLLGHEDIIMQAVWDASESRILTASGDGTARVWDAQTGAELLTVSGHTDAVWQAMWNADESRILTRSADGTARVWDAKTGQELLNLSGHTGSVRQAMWNADESRILTAGNDGTTRVWDAHTGEELLALFSHPEGLIQAAWNADESRILTAGCDGRDDSGDCSESTVRVWDAHTGEELLTLFSHPGGITQAMWNTDESRILTAGCDRRDDSGDCSESTARLWDAQSGRELVTFPGGAKNITRAAWNVDESRILIAGNSWISDYADMGLGFFFESTVRVWDVETGRVLLTLPGRRNRLLQAMWNRDGSRILTAKDHRLVQVWDADTGVELFSLPGSRAVWNRDGSLILTMGENVAMRENVVWVWDVSPGAELPILSGHTNGVRWAMWNGDESRILSASDDRTARVWDVETGGELLALYGHASSVKQAIWDKNESHILTASDDGTARVWDVRTGQELLTLSGHTESVRRAVWNADESRILTASNDATARVWDAQTGVELLILSGHTAVIWQAAWDKDEDRILTASDDSTARVWDAETGEELLILSGHTDRVLQAAWNSTGSRILTASGDGTARVWDAGTGEELLVLSGHAGFVWRVAWNKGESRILTASGDGTARVWDAKTGKVLLVLLSGGVGGVVDQARWNIDEDCILTAYDNTVRIWDVETGEELFTLLGHTGYVNRAVWSADGHHILTAGSDGTIRQWYARMEDLVEAACQRAPRNMTRQEWQWFLGNDAEYRVTCPDRPVPVWERSEIKLPLYSPPTTTPHSPVSPLISPLATPRE